MVSLKILDMIDVFQLTEEGNNTSLPLFLFYINVDSGKHVCLQSAFALPPALSSEKKLLKVGEPLEVEEYFYFYLILSISKADFLTQSTTTKDGLQCSL